MNELAVIAFELPQGLLTADGRLHRNGELRLATGADELYVSRHPQVRANPAAAPLVTLAATLLRLGDWAHPSIDQVGSLFLADFEYLIAVFNRCNPQATRRLGEWRATRSNGSTGKWPSLLITSTGAVLKSSPSTTPSVCGGCKKSWQF
ncbi:MAG: hypothetical protein HC910_01280 [Spirulinaceae cyanobacterium SM2_1_0]|nr:hypothetical protein [Spirulinaceae cyanobacterium SM2_1_0]